MDGTRAQFNIVVAEDDPDDRLLVREAVADGAPFAGIDFVEDGIELLDYLNRRNGYENLAGTALPSLILLDLNMPRMNGWEALAEIRADAGLKSMPVVALTTSASDDDIASIYELGANSFIVKPSGFDALVEIVNSLTHYWHDTVRLPPEKRRNRTP